MLTQNGDPLDFCLLVGEQSRGEFLIYCTGCASPRLHSAACATILSLGAAGLFTAWVVYGASLPRKSRKSPSRSLRPSVFFWSDPNPRPPTPSLDLCNKTINPDGYECTPARSPKQMRLRGRARRPGGKPGNAIAPSALFKMRGSVRGPLLNMCEGVCPLPLRLLFSGDQEARMVHNEGRTLHLCTRYGFFSRISL